jgi:hypothetical protein
MSQVRNGDEMGRIEVSVFVCNVSVWGDMGRNGVSPLEMGTEGRGRVSDIPTQQGSWRSLDSKKQDIQAIGGKGLKTKR